MLHFDFLDPFPLLLTGYPPLNLLLSYFLPGGLGQSDHPPILCPFYHLYHFYRLISTGAAAQVVDNCSVIEVVAAAVGAVGVAALGVALAVVALAVGYLVLVVIDVGKGLIPLVDASPPIGFGLSKWH